MSGGLDSARVSVVNLPVEQTAAPAIRPTKLRLFIVAPQIGDLDHNHRRSANYVIRWVYPEWQGKRFQLRFNLVLFSVIVKNGNLSGEISGD